MTTFVKHITRRTGKKFAKVWIARAGRRRLGLKNSAGKTLSVNKKDPFNKGLFIRKMCSPVPRILSWITITLSGLLGYKGGHL